MKCKGYISVIFCVMQSVVEGTCKTTFKYCGAGFLLKKKKKETAFQMFKNSKEKSLENFVDHGKQAISHNISCH